MPSALVVVVDDDDTEQAYETIASSGIAIACCLFVGNPWPVERRDEYDTPSVIEARTNPRREY